MPSARDSDPIELCRQSGSPVFLCLFSLSGILHTFFFSCPFHVLSIFSYFSLCCRTTLFALLNYLQQGILSLSEGPGKATLPSLKEFIPGASYFDKQRNWFFGYYSCMLKDRERPFFLGRRRLRVAGQASMNLPPATLRRRWQPTVITRSPITSPTTCTIPESWTISGCTCNTLTSQSTSGFW